MLLLLWVPIWVIIFIGTIIYQYNYYYEYDIPFYCFFIIFIISIIFVVKLKTESLNGKPIKKSSKIIFTIIFSLILSFTIIQWVPYLYTAFFGNEITYLAEIDNKRIKSYRNKTHHYVDIKFCKSNKTLDYAPLYFKAKIGSKIQIKENRSNIGHYIKYQDIKIFD